MRIIHLLPSLKKGGAERLCIDICNDLIRKGHEVQIIIFNESNDYKPFTREIPIHIIPSYMIPSITGSHKVNVHDLQQFVDKFQPDVIHVHLFEALMVASRLRSNAHWVIHFHDNMKQLHRWHWSFIFKKEKITNFYERFLVVQYLKKQAKLSFIGISKNTYEYITHNLFSFKNKTFLLHNAIDISRFNDLEIAKNDDNLQCAMVGSLVQKKNQQLAIRTIAELKKIGIFIKLHIIGDGSEANSLKLLANELQVDDRVFFHGIMDYPEKILKGCNFYLHTAYYEPFGLVILEAMACGLPVITTDGKGNRDLIMDGVNGYLVTHFDEKVLADTIIKLVKDKEKMESMGMQAKNFAKNYDLKNYTEKLLSIYSRYDNN